MSKALQFFSFLLLIFAMVQSEFILPPIISNSKRKSILNLASSKSLVHKPGTLPPSLFTLRRQKPKNGLGFGYNGLPSSCLSSLYQVKGSADHTSDYGTPASVVVNGEHHKVLLPPPSLNSLPPLVVQMSEHSTTASKSDPLQPCFSVDTKETIKSEGGDTLFAVAGGGHRERIHVAKEHRINIPNNKLFVHKKTKGKSGIPSSKLTIAYSSDPAIMKTSGSNGERVQQQQKSYSSSNVPSSNQLKLDLPGDVHKYQAGADICSIINLRMPLPSTLRTANNSCPGNSQEFVPSEAQARSNGANKKNGTSVIVLGSGCLEGKSNSYEKRRERKTRKIGKHGQLDQFNSALIQLKQVVSDSVCSESGEHGSTDVFKKKKRNRENPCRLNIVDLEKQAILLNDSAFPLMTTSQQYQQHKSLSSTSTNGGTGANTEPVEEDVDCASTYNQDEISSSGHSSSTETQLSEDPSHHSVHILHRISLPSNDDVMDPQVNKKTILNLFARTSGTGGGKAIETQCWNQMPTTPFAYYHFLRRNNGNSGGIIRSMTSTSPAPPLVSHEPILHHSLQSDLTIEGNRNSKSTNYHSMSGNEDCDDHVMEMHHDESKGKNSALPFITSPGLKSLKVAAVKLTPRSPPISGDPSVSKKKPKQPCQVSGTSIALEDPSKKGKYRSNIRHYTIFV
uniref:Uncharacterized protein n=1 Tax=Amphimedon queenslandica TaxID=400682 RepID=A0A1X7VHD3_AMPQE